MIREIILNYKFNDKSYLYKTIVNFLLKNEKIFEILKSYDTIIPVPISKKRKQERGYNQSSLIAKELVEQLTREKFTTRQHVKKELTIEQLKSHKMQKINYNDRCIFKTKNIIEQSKLNKQERVKNIQGVYKLKNKEQLYNKKILLIDDIYTTGSTVNECSKILTEANPQKIGILTIAKD